MMERLLQRDLIALVADTSMDHALRGVLSRHVSLGIRQVKFDSYVHPHRDPGCLREAHDFLGPLSRQYSYALVMLDHEGCGTEVVNRNDLEEQLEHQIAQSGWGSRVAAIVIAPELDAWVWSDSPQVDTVLGWLGRKPALREWLKEQGLLEAGAYKPRRPKEAVEQALECVRKARSAALYGELAQRVSVDRCVDPAFSKLKKVLQGWFRISNSEPPQTTP
jgi:hypothetical protein